MVKISDGLLRHRIAIEAGTRTPDAGGGTSNPWAAPTTVAEVWAAIQPLQGDERLRAQQLQSRVTHKIVLRYRPDIRTSHRVNFNGRIFNIRSVINLDERSRWLELMCEEGVAT
jgi:SPP1 family predicted phage head-tail adaptor